MHPQGTVQSVGLAGPESKSWPACFARVTWTSHFAPLSLCLLICTMEQLIIVTVYSIYYICTLRVIRRLNPVVITTLQR